MFKPLELSGGQLTVRQFGRSEQLLTSEGHSRSGPDVDKKVKRYPEEGIHYIDGKSNPKCVGKAAVLEVRMKGYY